MLLYECGWILHAYPDEGFMSITNPWVYEYHLDMGFYLNLCPAAQLSSLCHTTSFCFFQSQFSLSSLQLSVLSVIHYSFTIFFFNVLSSPPLVPVSVFCSICLYCFTWKALAVLSCLSLLFSLDSPIFSDGGYFGLLQLPSCFTQKHS